MQVRWLCGVGKRMLSCRWWRQILGAPMYTQVAALQGEIGASTVEGRDRKIRLGFWRYMFKTRNRLFRAMFQRKCGEIRPVRWMKQLREYMGELEISFDRLESMTKLELNRVWISGRRISGGDIWRVGQHCSCIGIRW